MALTTYAELTAVIIDELDNTDLASRADDFVSLAEADIRGRQEWFERIYSVDENAGLPLSVTQGLELPLYVKEVTALWPASAPAARGFEIVTAAGWRQLAQTNADASGTPLKAYISYDMMYERGPLLYLWPRASTQDVDFTFIKDLAPLASALNGFFLRNPDLYLYGALMQSAPFLQHDERIQTWEKFYERAVNRIQVELSRKKAAGNKNIVLPRSF